MISNFDKFYEMGEERDSGIELLSSLNSCLGGDTSWLLCDPLLANVPSPAEYGPSDCAFTEDESSPTKLFEPDPLASIVTFAEAVPDTGVSPFSKDLTSEVFQDLRHTSTPKTPTLSLSLGAGEERARKRIRFNGPEEVSDGHAQSWHVLHDITDDQNVSGDSFVRLTDIRRERVRKHENNNNNNDKPVHRTPVRRKVPILRGNSRRNSEREEEDQRAAMTIAATAEAAAASLGPNGVLEFLYPEKCAGVREMDKWLYYTGFTDYSLLLRLISHLAVPPRHGLSPFQILMMTMMRVRCELDWRDLGFRFRIFEPDVYGMVHSTLGLLAASLDTLLPWRSSPCRSPGIFLAEQITFRSEDGSPRQLIAIVSRYAIEEVCRPTIQSPTTMVDLSSLRHILRPGDVLAVRGLSRQPRPTFLALNLTGTFSFSPAPSPDFLPAATAVFDSLRQYRLVINNPMMTDSNMFNLVTAVAALINVQRNGITDAKLKHIHRISSTMV